MKIQKRFFRLFLVVVSLVIFCSSQPSIALADSTQEVFTVAQNGVIQNTSTMWRVTSVDSNGLASYCDNADKRSLPETLIPDLGHLEFPVTSKSEEARKFFNQGLTLFYGFNGEEAIRFFRKAADLDPDMAMAYYGMALAPETNINIEIDDKCEGFAFDQIQEAEKCMDEAEKRMEPITPIEHALIEALAVRYEDYPNRDFNELAIAYKNAMAKVYQDYPDQPDVATIYADSLMDLYPWILWKPDGSPNTPVTQTVVDVLEKALKSFPDHVGVNHYYIHAMEASAQPNKALDSANILEKLAPAAGHIVHMPSHIYARLGHYKEAAQQNEKAVKIDEPFVEQCKSLQTKECEPIYAGHYYTHNQLFRAVPYAMTGRSKDAIETAGLIEEYVPQYLEGQPGLEHYLPSKILMLERFGRWDEILSLPSPQYGTSATQAFWRWARAMAYLGKQDLASAKDEKDRFLVEVIKTPCNLSWGNNKAQEIIQIAVLELDAKIAYLEGKADDAIKMLKKAVHLPDNLVYDEPIPWHPVREALGAAYYANGQYSKAEQVFWKDLFGSNGKIERIYNPSNGRSLFGLYESLKAQGKPFENIKGKFDKIWAKADVELKMSDLF
ncbi:tetratricopeptide repeat protein [Coleofasciculus sp.]|uniref:tetratricopeptide repeat protein n=1 Tax=Coleofasciculus sp. TaxID=3100458 RepID=UPI0039F9CCA6